VFVLETPIDCRESVKPALYFGDEHVVLLAARANSRYRSTCSRVTVGHPARKSSIVKPVLRSSSKIRTGTRVPRKHGVPCIRCGSTDTISLMRVLASPFRHLQHTMTLTGAAMG
jgi:hypothetical protein